jgi:hypothetical protein
MLLVPLLHACGGGGDDDTGRASVRLVNITQDYGALDFYAGDTRQVAALAAGTAGDYVALGEGSYSFKLRPAGGSTNVWTQTNSLSKDTAYTLVTYNNGTSLTASWLTDGQSAPTSGYASLRVFNTSGDTGSVDVYVTTADASLADVSPNVGSLPGANLGGYGEIAKGSYRIRVTGAGDKTDLRLDIPAVTLADQQIATLILRPAAGGVLVHGWLLNQQGTLSGHANTQARLRVVASVTGNGVVAAATSDATLSVSLQSPSVGSYVTTPATLAGLAVKVNGTALDTSSLSVAAGADATLLVHGDAAAPQWTLLSEDNRPAASSSQTKLRLVHAVQGLASTLSFNVDYVTIAESVAYGTASTPSGATAGTAMRLEVMSPVRTTPLYQATSVSLAAQKVYTLFMLGDAATPVPLLRKDR